MANEFNRFTVAPSGTKITRTRIEISHSHTTTMNAGSLYPIARWEVLPSDTFTMDLSTLARMLTPIHPVMDNCYLDVYFFFVPNRLAWDHWKEFMGESTDGFLPDVEYEEPSVLLQSNVKGSIYDHFEIPQGNVSTAISALPIRQYGIIWNDWFRDQNVSSEVYVPRNDAQVLVSSATGDDVSWFKAGLRQDMVTDWMQGRPLPVAKFHDLFTSALPQPQRGPAVALPLAEGDLPILTGAEYTPSSFSGMKMVDSSGQAQPDGFVSTYQGLLQNTGAETQGGDPVLPFPVEGTGLVPSNLYADTSYLNAISINVFRQAYAMQRLYERSARSGSRYTELIRSAFGCVSPDARLQRPELIGCKRIPITMSQVVQNSSTDSTSPQGNTAAFSLTQDKSSMFTYSSTEHGNIIGVACIRTDHTYQQGIGKEWTRRRRFDYYDPIFANLGEQAILNRELCVSSDAKTNEEVFGYQEAWYEYRYKPSRVCGEMSSLYPQSLDVWHYSDVFGSWNAEHEVFTPDVPTLSAEFIYETRENIDRTLAVDSSLSDQFLVQFYFRTYATRPMPLFSVPGLSGHY